MASTFVDFLSTAANAAATTAGQEGVDPFSLLAGVYDTVEIRSNAAPPMQINVRELGQGEPSPYTRALQPTIVFSGPAGRYVWAPYGEANSVTGTMTSIGALVALTGIGFVLGRLSKR